MFHTDTFGAIRYALHRDNRYRAKPKVSVSKPDRVTFTDDALRAVTLPEPFSARLRVGGWRMEG